MATALVDNLAMYTKPEKFEQTAMLHQAVRGMTASHLALWQGRQTVSARDLYCGTDCTDAFTRREFEPVTQRRLLPPVAAVPWPTAKEASGKIRLQSGTVVDVTSDELGAFVVHLGGRNAMDAAWREWALSGTVRSRVLAVMDTKHVAADSRPGRITETLVEVLAKKRQQLRRVLHPAEMEVLAVLVSLAARRDGPDDVSEWLQSSTWGDDWTCVVSASGGRLAWSLSPVLAYLLSNGPQS